MLGWLDGLQGKIGKISKGIPVPVFIWLIGLNNPFNKLTVS